MANILITGAAGFLGSHLSEYFLNRGDSVLGIDNFCTGQRANIQKLKPFDRFRFIEGDVCESSVWQSISSSFDSLLHLASPASPPKYAQLALETMKVNSEGLWKALEFATSHRARLVFASTSEVYGDPLVAPQPESYFGNVNPVGPRSCYDESKRFGESLVFSFNKARGTQHGIVRLFNSYGPQMDLADGRVITNFVQQILLKQPLRIYGDGQQTRSFCYVDDTVRGIASYLKSSETEPMNIGTDCEITILELVKKFEEVVGQKLETSRQELPADDPKKRRPDLARVKARLGWAPQVELKDGLRKTLDSFA